MGRRLAAWAGRRLAAWVYVTGLDGLSVGFGPEHDIPDWAAEQITNPNAWAADPVLLDDEEAAAPVGAATDPAGPVAPPKAGPGSGLAEWAEYARSLGIDVSDSATRGDVMTLVEEHEQK